MPVFFANKTYPNAEGKRTWILSQKVGLHGFSLLERKAPPKSNKSPKRDQPRCSISTATGLMLAGQDS